MSCGKKAFAKPPLNIQDQLSLLESRGLLIPDHERAARYLKYIGYYRLALYSRPFQKKEDPGHAFLPGVSFDDILDLYIFDRKLRLLFMDAIERVEVAVRAVISDHMSLKYGSHWYLDCNLLKRKKRMKHFDFIDIVKKETGYSSSDSGPVFCKNYFSKYCDPLLPPSWMVAEVLTIGTWSRVYSALTEGADRKVISNAFDIRYSLFGSWIHSVSYARNICAHHSLLWNATFTVKPKMSDEFAGLKNNSTFYAVAVVLYHFMKSISTNPSWKHRLAKHLDTCPTACKNQLCFPDSWQEADYWR